MAANSLSIVRNILDEVAQGAGPDEVLHADAFGLDMPSAKVLA